jgi:hypothetical protein
MTTTTPRPATPARIARAIVIAAVLVPAGGGAAWARGPWRADDANTPGWKFMSQEERVEHQRRMRSFETFEACAAYQAEHHALIAERARRAGVELGPGKGRGTCEELKAQGRLK